VGVDWLVRRAPRLFPARAAARVREAFAQRGLWALALSRFLPAVRAVVPPVAGAVGVPVWSAAIAMTVASAAWYAVVCALAFRAGTNAEALLAAVARQQRLLGGVAVGLLVVAGAAWWRRRGRTRD
jgi:membrane protein DedA with SNARE-associated domain